MERLLPTGKPVWFGGGGVEYFSNAGECRVKRQFLLPASQRRLFKICIRDLPQATDTFYFSTEICNKPRAGLAHFASEICLKPLVLFTSHMRFAFGRGHIQPMSHQKIPHTADKASLDRCGQQHQYHGRVDQEYPKSQFFFEKRKNHPKPKNPKTSRDMPKLAIYPLTRVHFLQNL